MSWESTAYYREIFLQCMKFKLPGEWALQKKAKPAISKDSCTFIDARGERGWNLSGLTCIKCNYLGSIGFEPSLWCDTVVKCCANGNLLLQFMPGAHCVLCNAEAILVKIYDYRYDYTSCIASRNVRDAFMFRVVKWQTLYLRLLY